MACGGLTAYRATLHGVDRLRERGAEAKALVIGAGGLGQYAIRYLRLLTDAHVTALDLAEVKQVTALDTRSALHRPMVQLRMDRVRRAVGGSGYQARTSARRIHHR